MGGGMVPRAELAEIQGIAFGLEKKVERLEKELGAAKAELAELLRERGSWGRENLALREELAEAQADLSGSEAAFDMVAGPHLWGEEEE